MKLNEVEIKAIKIWTSSEMHEYRYIKDIQKGIYNGNLYAYYKKYAQALIDLFNKYKDNTEGQILYRGDVLEALHDGLTEKEIYENYLTNNPIGKYIEFENTILSFTLLKDIAVKSYANSDKNKKESTPTILYILENRKSTFIDISNYSEFPHEKEVLCNKNIKFKVVDIEEKDNNNLVYHIEEYCDTL